MVTRGVGGGPSATGRRIEPSVRVAVAAVVVYMLVVNGIQVSSGIPYGDWFDSAANAVRTAVIPLAVANTLLLAFLAWARWDIVWRDPERLPLSRLARVVLGLFAVAVLVRLVTVQWAEVPLDLLLALVAVGALVGPAEELLFRGIVLRSLRTDRRPESTAALWTAVGFGLFHLPNVVLGSGATGFLQVALAAFSGYALYLFRRWRGVLVTAMVAHGLWDVSTFLSGSHSSPLGALVGVVLSIALAVLCVVALLRSLSSDRHITVTPEGVVPLGRR